MEALVILKQKVETLISLHSSLLEENRILISKNNQLEDLVANLQNEVNELQNKKVELSETIKNTDDSSLRIKQRIDEIVSEIDKCITDLNK